jgi:hypothetical protein
LAAGSVITSGLPVASQSYATAEMSVMHASANPTATVALAINQVPLADFAAVSGCLVRSAMGR